MNGVVALSEGSAELLNGSLNTLIGMLNSDKVVIIADMLNSDKIVMSLIHGETGTGKDVLTTCIHTLSGRRGAFIGINCAAILGGLAESQLFGVMSGALTGARHAGQGYIEASNGGTLYLDEIDSMPLSLQANLLPILETRGVKRLGSTRFVPLDLRVIASTQ